ncbi:MAG TPA: phage tail tube protein [Noviherbaspirillum sp.]|jgi:hypothetical protein|uniref:phage tail tube protein n=1 Tax=Noviherbaspirillum sp. TaxID=1926288 RepID=UPI002DDD5E8D|nr:phage tail tube protein [Noviherbaspirillum sp.]HEV2612541.1 phage tail tube protein [Noviherbaspirillum sp.]
MASVPTGTTFFIASAYAAAIPTTIVSNAAEAVVTATAHGLANGDIVEVTSGWGRLHKRIARVKTAAANTFVLEGMDTSSLNFFPAGQGIGSVRKVNTFTQITGVLATSFSGGDPINVSYKYLESDVQSSINDGFNPVNGTLNIDADMIGTAGYNAAKTLTDVQTDTCVLMVSRNGSKVYRPCTVALNEEVTVNDGNINQVVLSVNGNNRSTRYAS